MPFIRSLAVALFALGALGGTAHAQTKQEKLDLILNWVPGGDHVPYYYAKKMGWYRDAGIDRRHDGSGLLLPRRRTLPCYTENDPS